MKKKVLIVTDEMEVGGSQRQIVRLIKNIDLSQFSIELAYFSNPSFLLDEIKPYCHKIWFLNKTKTFDLNFFSQLFKLCRRKDIDIIHCFAFSAEIWVTIAKILGFSRKKLITSIRGRYEWYGKVQWFLKSVASFFSTRIISNSQSGADYALENMFAVNKNKISIVYNGIEAKPETEVSQYELNTEWCNQNIILFVGRLVEDKNIPCLLRAVSEIKGISYQLKIVGDGPLRGSLEQLSSSLNINVEFLGERFDVDNLMMSSKVVVLPSFREGVSNTIIEAMLNKTTVVASCVGGTPEIITHGTDGLLFKSDKALELAGYLQQVLSDDELRKRLALNAYKTVTKRFAIERMVEEVESIYTLELETKG
ncbi:glycosyltransferase family 4 protein [Aliikangiella sp. IMCC44359]|uniref:glycosyltransferase family 4 protein n=1 Tax=Aliikangiella sp. IMCC44359 TaxID=3459125 RepID=UPI00403AE3D2